MTNAVSKVKPTIHQATYRLVQKLATQIAPLSKLAGSSNDPDQPDPMDTMVGLLREMVTGIDQVQARLENIEARLDDPAVVRAIKAAAHG